VKQNVNLDLSSNSRLSKEKFCFPPVKTTLLRGALLPRGLELSRLLLNLGSETFSFSPPPRNLENLFLFPVVPLPYFSTPYNFWSRLQCEGPTEPNTAILRARPTLSARGTPSFVEFLISSPLFCKTVSLEEAFRSSSAICSFRSSGLQDSFMRQPLFHRPRIFLSSGPGRRVSFFYPPPFTTVDDVFFLSLTILMSLFLQSIAPYENIRDSPFCT